VKRTLTLRGHTAPAAERLPRRPTGSAAPASFGQEQIWLHGQLAPDLPLYTESLTIRHRGPLDPQALSRSFDELVQRHEIWRTTFAWSDGQLRQEAHAPAPRLALTDLRHLPTGEREPAALRLAADDLRRPFDLSWEPGIRARLVHLSDDDQRLFLCLHHIVFDGISIYRVFLPDLATLYRIEMGEAVRGPDEPPLQYGDFAYWERHNADEAAVQPVLAYWRNGLAGAPNTIAVPTDRPRPAVQSFRGGLVRFELPPALTASLRGAALREQCTLFMFLLTGFAVTLYRRSGQTDMLIGSVSGGRDRPELERLIGYFLRILVIRADLTGDPSFHELAQRIRRVLVEALSHDAVPFQWLVRALAPARDLGRSPLFQVTFSIEPPLPALGAEWDLTEMDAGTTVSKFDLSLELEDRGEVIGGRAIYSQDLFDPDTIEALTTEYAAVLAGAVEHPDAPVSTGAERGT
jgi:hypothetical protein